MGDGSYHFGEFELDRERFELRRDGHALKLERIPLELLLLLAERQGAVVSRQAIIDRLWGKDVFVDTEHGINVAIRKIRQVLKDNPEQPRFVQTVTGKGYRFVAEINSAKPEVQRPGQSQPPEAPQPTWGQPPRVPSGPEVPGRSLTTTDIKPAPVSSKKIKVTAAVALCLFTASALTFLFRNRIFPTHAVQIHSIAVLPLANLSGDSSQDYFADGMTDELITSLAKSHNLRVVSRTSAMQFKGANRPVRDIARELGVDGILEGSIERTSNHVHMTVQLIYAPTDSHVWAESYDRDLNRAYELPEELSQVIAKEVKAATSPAPTKRYISPEAHDAYLHGRYSWFVNSDASTRDYFEKAIQLQPDYAAAWSGLSDYYGGGAVTGQLDPQEVRSKWEAAARKAVELDDSLAEVHNSLAAFYFFGNWDCAHADTESQRAIALDPNYAEARHLRSYILMVMNRPDEAVQEQKRGTELDPFQRPWALGYTYYHLRQFDAAMTELRLRAAANPNEGSTPFILSDVYWSKAMFKEGVQEVERGFLTAGDRASADAVANAFQRGGSAAVAEWRWQNTRTVGHHGASPWWRATDCARARHKEETLKLLEAAYGEHSPRLIFLQNEPLFDFLHSDPRYRALVGRMGLPPAY